VKKRESIADNHVRLLSALRRNVYRHVTEHVGNATQSLLFPCIHYLQRQFFILRLCGEVLLASYDSYPIGSTDPFSTIVTKLEAILNGGNEDRGSFLDA